MSSFPDTSFLCALYRFQANSSLAAAHFALLPGSLEVTSLLLFEFRQSVRFQVRLNLHDPQKGFSKADGVTMMAQLDSDLASGALTLRSAPWTQVHSTAERLSSQHTEAGGHRTLDILHVATALEFGVTEFLTFDKNQKRLAMAEGLAVPF